MTTHEKALREAAKAWLDTSGPNSEPLEAALSAASTLTAGEREPVEHQWRGKEGGVMLEKARDALETAADKILSDYRIWIADDTEAKPRYGQIPEYDMVNAVSGEIDRHLRSSALPSSPVGELAERLQSWDHCWPAPGLENAVAEAASTLATLEAEVSRLTALVDEAAGVVGPFADTADHDIGDDEADEDIFHPMTNHNSAMKITVGHMRAARAFAEKAGA